jgi:hypothetical protein
MLEHARVKGVFGQVIAAGILHGLDKTRRLI